MNNLPHWSRLLTSGCLCGHFEECEWCSNIDWCEKTPEESTPEAYAKADFVMGESYSGERWLCKRAWAKQHGWKIHEITDVLKDKVYRQ